MGALAWESGPGDPHLFLPPPLPPPPLPWRHVWNHSKPYTPEKTILCLNSVSWPLSSGSASPIPHNQLFTRGSALHSCSLIWAHFIPQHIPLVCFWTHTTASVLLALCFWHEVTVVATCIPSAHPTDILLLSFLSLLITAVDSPGWGCLSSTGLLTMQSTSLFLSSLFPPFLPSD